MRLALIAGLLAAGAAVAAPTSPPEWSTPTDPFRVADNLYYVGTRGISAWLITTPGGHIVIDGAMPTSAPLIKSSIRRLGFEPKDVKLLLNTHAHFDHTGGLADLKRDTGARLLANPADRKALESGTYPGWEENRGLDFAPVKVDADLADGRPVKLGGAVLTPHFTPGHSPGCTTWTFRVADAGRPLDVLLYCSTSVAANRLVSRERGPQYPGIVADYRRSFALLKTFRADVFLAPHAEQFGLPEKRARLKAGGANPFVDRGELARRVA
ncbi:MAG: subclass B3 metallo-beta-lactamase, partial [Phenylobacterium sp.]